MRREGGHAERKTGFEPATLSLATRCATTAPLPRFASPRREVYRDHAGTPERVYPRRMDRLTVGEVARRLSRHPELIRRWLREGRLKGEQYGREWLVTRREVDRFRRTEPERRRRV